MSQIVSISWLSPGGPGFRGEWSMDVPNHEMAIAMAMTEFMSVEMFKLANAFESRQPIIITASIHHQPREGEKPKSSIPEGSIAPGGLYVVGQVIPNPSDN